ncbi:hypothetical protein [Paenibacillus sp. FSL R7-0652]|uniref:Uncharacterized protein n=1 Tax=Paenibacillus sp. AN1007 TaxID=3151385 RepID=A0AAU8NG79_9BACL
MSENEKMDSQQWSIFFILRTDCGAKKLTFNREFMSRARMGSLIPIGLDGVDYSDYKMSMSVRLVPKKWSLKEKY